MLFRSYFIIAHDLSREGLSKCHEGLGNRLSRTINEPNKEIETFYPEFSLVKAEETKASYLLVGKKKT